MVICQDLESPVYFVNLHVLNLNTGKVRKEEDHIHNTFISSIYMKIRPKQFIQRQTSKLNFSRHAENGTKILGQKLEYIWLRNTGPTDSSSY